MLPRVGKNMQTGVSIHQQQNTDKEIIKKNEEGNDNDVDDTDDDNDDGEMKMDVEKNDKYILSHRYREILRVGYSVATSPKDEWHAVSNE